MSAAHVRRGTGPATHCGFCHATSGSLTGYACRPFTLLFIERGRALLIKEIGGIVTRYPAAPGDGAVYTFCSVGGWAACPACAALIDAGDAPALERRMVAHLADPGLPLAHRQGIERQIVATLGAFWRHRPCLN